MEMFRRHKEAHQLLVNSRCSLFVSSIDQLAPKKEYARIMACCVN